MTVGNALPKIVHDHESSGEYMKLFNDIGMAELLKPIKVYIVNYNNVGYEIPIELVLQLYQ